MADAVELFRHQILDVLVDSVSTDTSMVLFPEMYHEEDYPNGKWHPCLAGGQEGIRAVPHTFLEMAYYSNSLKEKTVDFLQTIQSTFPISDYSEAYLRLAAVAFLYRSCYLDEVTGLVVDAYNVFVPPPDKLEQRVWQIGYDFSGIQRLSDTERRRNAQEFTAVFNRALKASEAYYDTKKRQEQLVG